MINDWKLKEEVCEVGRRLYARQLVSANDGNITVRVGRNELLCTPTGMSKGSMKPADLCTCDLEGKRTGGTREITSEVKLHLAVYNGLPDVNAVVHCHAPYATAFSIAGIEIPTCIMPEVEIAIGIIPTSSYETPGTQAFAETLEPFLDRANTVILAHHGIITWGETLELAHFRTEMLEAYCRILGLAKDLGNVNRIPGEKVLELLDARPGYGFTDEDPRRRLENVDLCANADFGRGYTDAQPCAAPTGPSADRITPVEYEQLVQAITDQVMDAVGKVGE